MLCRTLQLSCAINNLCIQERREHDLSTGTKLCSDPDSVPILCTKKNA